MTSVSLDTLPTEILYRILTHGPTSNALALSYVSKHFHTVCRDPLLYADIIKYNSGFCYSLNISGDSWWQSLSLTSENNWDVHARWAFADEKAYETYMKWCVPHTLSHAVHFTGGQIGTSEILAWLPDLILQRHPTAQHLLEQRRAIALSSLNFDTTSVDLTSRLAFCDACLSTLLLGENRAFFQVYRSDDPPELEGPYYEYAIAAYRRINPAINLTVLSLAQSVDLMPEGPYTDLRPSVGENNQTDPGFIKYILLSTLIAGTLRRALSLALDRGRIQRRHANAPNRYPPSARDIPFPHIHNSNHLPFTTSETDDYNSTFLARHLPIMTSPGFLVDDQWLGYYCYVNTASVPLWDTMMHSIQFSVSADYADHCAIQSRGEDGCGAFLLFGIVHKRSGWIQMTKQYDDDVTWLWSAVMTPFGIVGSWGSSRGEGGWIWLWKSAWSGSAVSFRPPATTPDLMHMF